MVEGDGLSAPGEVSERLRHERDALRVEVARLQQRLAEVELLADRDPLAPVLNRRAFVRELQRTIAFCRRYDTPATLVFFDLDRFKLVNDSFGHATGDAVLATVARILIDNVRESDVVGRLGGDEFAVILDRADQASGQAKAQTLVELVQAQTVFHKAIPIAVRISAGVRAYDGEGDAAQWLAQADAAMFVRKGARAPQDERTGADEMIKR